jgi:signal transduction histidine kinase
MTLRRRLLLVYLIIVVLSCATVGIAVNELLYSRRVVDDLERWQDILVNVQKLRTAFARNLLVYPTSQPADRPSAAEPAEEDFQALVDRVRKVYRPYHDFLDARYILNVLSEAYDLWREQALANDPHRFDQADIVQARLGLLTGQIEAQRSFLVTSVHEQNQRTVSLLIVVMMLTVVHLAVVGTILRRSLLRPMEQLGRQVTALGRDEPPPEPLVSSPAELANLAEALDRARLSLDEMRHKLLESERMTTVGQFAAQLAHNLRNPLASIRAAAQVAAKRGSVDEYARKRLDEIVAAADRLAQWVAGLMEFARPRSAGLESRDVVPLLAQIKEAVAAELAAKEVSFEIEAPPDGLAVPHEPPSLEQALIAAVVNAIEASPVGGRITARAEWIDGIGGDTRFCRISIIDEGHGLPEGPSDQIFELNFTTKQAGMGLGLTLARQAIQRQGGTATARPNPQGGTIIEFQLPAPLTEPAKG